MTRRTSSSPGAAVFGFMFWELVKIAVAVAMLVAAPRVVPDLSWPALLVPCRVREGPLAVAALAATPVSEIKERH